MLTANSKVIRLSLNAKETDVRKLATVYTQSQFFTSDTDAWIVFGVPDLDLTGTTAMLKITNTTEGISGSAIELVLEPELIEEVLYFCFEMSQTIGEDSPIRHAGTWLGQISITKAGKDLTTHKFVFSVESDILDTNENLGLIMVQTFNSLIESMELQKSQQQIEFDQMTTITDDGTGVYKWHFSMQDGVLVFNYEEVI